MRMLGSCHFMKCKNEDENQKCVLGINQNDGVLVICSHFEKDK